jgi:hypothetical protein
MPVQSNVSFIFQSPDGGFTPAYEVLDEPYAGVKMNFTCPDPGPGQVSNYTITLTDTELSAVTNQAQLQNLVISKLGRRIRATNIASKLDQFIGQSVGPL